ncbi:MAG TPA: response regulator [Anaeromyxobacteraceae bacterium]|nr:response regulator [Anaeromyxobacteraceae bacterium]
MPDVILFVDDEPEVLAVLRRIFTERDGYLALTASGGEEALAILGSREIDLLVTDQRMPGMTGIELAAAARRLRPGMCVILLTAFTDPRDIIDAINKGEVYRYLTKPWEYVDLRQAILRALEQVKLKREQARLDAALERRIAALELATEIARDVGLAESRQALLERLLDRLPRVVKCDAAAALLVPDVGPPALVLRPVAALSDRALLRLREDALAAWTERTGRVVPEKALQVRVTSTGGDGVATGFASRLTVSVHVLGKPVGVIVVECVGEEAYGEGDARVLDLLVNEMGEALAAFAATSLAERRRLEQVVEAMADGLVVVRAGSDEVIANPAARRMLGAAPDGPVKARWLAEVLGFDPLERAHELATALDAGTFVSEELRVRERTLSWALTRVVEAEGRLGGVAVVLRDVTEQKRLDERKEEFVQVVSHELRTPLTSITGALDLILQELAGPVPPKQARYLKMARDSAEKLNVMVDDLLDLSRLAKDKMRMEVELTPLDELVRGAVERFQGAAAEKGVDLQIESPVPEVRAIVDGERIVQVLSNLLTNAVKFTPGGGAIRVRLLLSADYPSGVAVSVWNSGEAIQEADLERIFDRFEQARNDRTRRVRGTGLGLAISRGIVEAHGGAIWAESAPGDGARFVTVLPIEPPPERAQEGERRIGADAPLALVVENADAAPFARWILGRAGWRVRAVPSPEEALALSRRSPPALVVYEPELPGLRDVRFAEVVRSDAETRRTALLAVSAPAAREGALRSGADAFLPKPVAPMELAAAAAELVRPRGAAGARVLVVDDDPSIRAICVEVLAGHGYTVLEAADCAGARDVVLTGRPELVILDVQLPDGDGFELAEELAPARASSPFGLIFLTARGGTADKVRGLRLGADDYVTKPFDAQELVARVDAVIRRRETALHASPMTRLPGGRAIDLEVTRRLDAGLPFGLSYLDLDNLKAYNDTYGYAKADGVLIQLAAILRETVAAHGGDGAFLGHVGGDDFVLLTAPERAASVCGEAIAAFDRVIPLYYDREDRERGFIEATDRFGARRQFPLLALSAATVMATPGRFRGHAELARAAAELKHRAKEVPGSVHLVDPPTAGTRADP